MSGALLKVSEIAEMLQVSPDTVNFWIRQGKIPSNCVLRIAGTIRIDEDKFRQFIRGYKRDKRDTISQNDSSRSDH